MTVASIRDKLSDHHSLGLLIIFTSSLNTPPGELVGVSLCVGVDRNSHKSFQWWIETRCKDNRKAQDSGVALASCMIENAPTILWWDTHGASPQIYIFHIYAWPKFTQTPHLHQTKIYTNPDLHQTHIYTAQIYTNPCPHIYFTGFPFFWYLSPSKAIQPTR